MTDAELSTFYKTVHLSKRIIWRRERDSNPRYRFEGGTRDFQSRSFGQLGHLSAVSLTRNTIG
jgi:hypothetical protein